MRLAHICEATGLDGAQVTERVREGNGGEVCEKPHDFKLPHSWSLMQVETASECLMHESPASNKHAGCQFESSCMSPPPAWITRQ